MNKSRYDSVTSKHLEEYEVNKRRLEEASAREEALMKKLQQTMQVQRHAISELETAIGENKIPKVKRFHQRSNTEVR